MKHKNINLSGFITVIVILIIITSCDNLGTINMLTGGLRSSIQVNNKLGARAAGNLTETDIVELYIEQFQYFEDAAPRSLAIIANGDWHKGSLGGYLDNAGWYSVHADLEVANTRTDTESGPYSSFFIVIPKIRINGVEYSIGSNTGAIFGTPSPGRNVGSFSVYPDNFNGIIVTNRTVEIKTIMTVEPEIKGIPNSSGYNSQGLSTEPFKFIKVEGIIIE